MLGHALTAKTAKMNKKLKMIELQMKKMKLDKDTGTIEAGKRADLAVFDADPLGIVHIEPNELNIFVAVAFASRASRR